MKTLKIIFLLLFAANLSFAQNQECLPDNRTFPENNPLHTVKVFGVAGTFSGTSSCVETGTNAIITFQPTCPAGSNSSVSFSLEGGLELVSQSGNQVTVKPVAEQGLQYPRYNKGRITADYTCSYDTTVFVSVPCIDDSTAPYTYTIVREGRSYADLYQQFPWDAPIVGPVCVTQGERVTYSIFDYVSGTSNTGIGIDDYKWCFPDNWDLAYFSADHSSITLDATSINPGEDVITVQVGRCNSRDTSKIIGQLLPAPDTMLSVCLNGTGTSLSIPLTPNPNITYLWDITADGNGYTYVSGNENTQGSVTINVGNNSSGFVLLISSATPGNGVYCDEATRTDTIAWFRNNLNPVISGPTCVMPGGNYNYTVDLAAPVTWTLPTGYTITSSNPNAAQITVSIDNNVVSGNVSAVSSNPSCGSGSPAYLYVEAGPEKPVISGPACFDQNTNIVYSATANNAHNFQWTFPSGFSPSTSGGNNINVYTGTSAGGNIVVYATKSGCPDSDTTILQVLPKPGDVTFINSNQNCLNQGMPDTITLSTNCGMGEYEWTLPANWIISGDETTCSITVITDGTGGTVSVKAVNDCGEGQSFQRNFSADGIGQNVSISQYPNNQGTGVILEVNIFGASYQWYQDGTPIPGGRLLDLPYADTVNHEYCVAVSYGQCASMACEDADYTPNARIAAPASFEPEALAEIAISPNPANQYIELTAPAGLEGVEFSVVSTNGIEITSGILKAGQNKININEWTGGTYIVNYAVNGKIKSKKFQVIK